MPPYRIEWSDEARTDVRSLDREIAMRIFESLLHFARTGSGDMAALHALVTTASVQVGERHNTRIRRPALQRSLPRMRRLRVAAVTWVRPG